MSGSGSWGKHWGALTLAVALLLPPTDFAFAQAPPPPTLAIEALGADLTLFGPSNSLLSITGTGRSIASCDLNGDGIQDLLVGASVDQVHGGAFVIYGSNAAPPGTIRDLTSGADVSIRVPQGAFGAGNAVACADVNGDSEDDIMIGAYEGRGPNGDRPGAGQVYVIYDVPNLPPVIDLALTPADVTIWGNSVFTSPTSVVGDNLGYSLALGDLNGDSIDDLIMGAFGNGGPNASRTARSGAVFVVYGRSDLPATIDFASESPDLVLYGEERDDVASITVAAGDLDGDGFDDLVVGAVGGDGPNNSRGGTAGANAGEVYVVLGSASLPPIVDVAGVVGPPPDVRLYGAVGQFTNSFGTFTIGDGFGGSLAIADINGDTLKDILIGAFTGGAAVGRPQAGTVYVVFGGTLPPVLDMAAELAPGANLVMRGAAGSLTFGDDNLGSAVASGDVNGDGITDILAVAENGNGPFRRLSVGAVYAYYGGANLPAVMDVRGELGPAPDVILYSGGGPANTSPGFLKVAAGDVNGDGVDELIAGSPLTPIPPPWDSPTEFRLQAGSVHVFSIPRLAALPAPPTPTRAHYNERKKKLFITVPGAAGDEVVEINGHLVGPWWEIRRELRFNPDTSQFVLNGRRSKLFLSKTPGVNTVVIIKDGLRSSPLFF